MEKEAFGYTLPVFVITKTGNDLTDEGIDVVRNMCLGEEDDPYINKPNWRECVRSKLPENTNGVLIHTGPDLLDSGHLASLLEKDPNSRVLISYGDSFVMLGYGPDEETGLPPLICNLKKAAELDLDSWTMIEKALAN